jgi:hypothetical protein
MNVFSVVNYYIDQRNRYKPMFNHPCNIIPDVLKNDKWATRLSPLTVRVEWHWQLSLSDACHSTIDRIGNFFVSLPCLLRHPWNKGRGLIINLVIFKIKPGLILLFDGRFGVAVGILAYYARGRGFDLRTVQKFVCIITKTKMYISMYLSVI